MQEGNQHDLTTEGLTALIQECEEKGSVSKLISVAENPNSNHQTIFRLAKDLGSDIAFSKWYRDDPTAKSKGEKYTKS